MSCRCFHARADEIAKVKSTMALRTGEKTFVLRRLLQGTRAGTQGHPQADLARPLAYRVRHHAVDASHGP